MTIPSYDFLAPQRIVFGWGRRREIGSLAASLGHRAFVVTGSRTLERSGVLGSLTKSLNAAGVEAIPMGNISHEPEVADVDRLTAIVQSNQPRLGDSVIGIGGGSAIDLAKAVAAMATQRASGTVADYLEGVGRGLSIIEPPLPMLAMPTTAGTGSEATKNAVISSYDPPFKKSLRSDSMVPRIVLIDPELSSSMPAEVTKHCGMDAITQLIESYISARAKPIPQALAIQGLQWALPAIQEAVSNGQNRSAREAMAHAALLSGLALANSGLGLAHAVAAALGAHCRVPHGLACAVMLPVALRINRGVAMSGLATLGRATCLDDEQGNPHDDGAADEFIEHVVSITRTLEIPTRLRDLGVAQDQIAKLVEGSHGNSLAGNPRKLTDAELRDVFSEIW
ncbi:MAG TPA: iron-containing alcohol dehydrogenase [Pirellulales bacterium]